VAVSYDTSVCVCSEGGRVCRDGQFCCHFVLVIFIQTLDVMIYNFFIQVS